MKPRYRPIVRSARGATYYCFDTYTKRRTSLKTADRHEAARILNAKNEAAIQPMLNLQIARAYLFGSDDHIAKRTWRDAILALTETKLGSNKERWQRAQKEKAFAPLWSRPLVETKGEELLAVLRKGGVSTNQHLRRLHNFRVDMNWLPWPLVPKRQWPAIRHKEKRAITWEEHCRIVAREGNAERKAFYQLAWHLGASQGDLANLHAEDVDWTSGTITYLCPHEDQMAREPDATSDQIRAIGHRHPQHAAQGRAAVSVSPRPSPRLSGQRISRALPRVGHSGHQPAQLPLRVGRAGKDGRLPRTLRPDGSPS